MRVTVNYANVMATVACFVALGGGAYAAATIDSDDIARNAVLSKHIKNNKVTGKDVKESSLKGLAPLAYAHIVNHAVVPSRSRGVTLESDSSGGTYCLRVTGTAKNVQVTVDSNSLDTAVATLNPSGACTASADIEVLTGHLGSFADKDFFVLIH